MGTAKTGRQSRSVTSELLDNAPPHDINAEMCVVGSMLIHPPACDEVLLAVRREDFYDDAYGELFTVLAGMWESGKSIDVSLLVSRLEKLGLYERIGGPTTLASVTTCVPNAAHAVYYANIVREKAAYRQLIDAATLMLRDAYDARTDATEISAKAEQSIFAINERTVTEPREAMSVLHDAMEAIEMRRSGKLAGGVSTGYRGLDDKLGGLRAGELIVIAGRPAMGKAQPLDATALTPSGFAKFGDLCVGDFVIGRDGKPTPITEVIPQGELAVYRVITSDGGETECCDDHLWFTQSRNERRRGCAGSVKRLEQIRETIHRRDADSPNHALPLVAKVEFAAHPPLLLSPYLMGLLLGDGCFGRNVQFTKPESDLHEAIHAHLPAADVAVDAGRGTLRIKRKTKTKERSDTCQALMSYGLYERDSLSKFIPLDYLLGSANERLELLRGLCDTDGFVTSCGQSVEFSTSSPQLAADVAFLVRSLGGVASTRTRVPIYQLRGESLEGAEASRIVLYFPDGTVPVSSEKHKRAWSWKQSRQHRSITQVEFVGYKQCQCIRVAADDGLYVTDDFIVTHNSSLALNIAERAALDHGAKVLFISLEMSALELGDRLVCGRARVPLYKARNGRVNAEDCQKLMQAADAIARDTLYIDDDAMQTVSQISAKARRMKRRKGLDLVCVDYLQLIAPDDAHIPRHEQVAAMTRQLKILAKQIGVAVIVVAQLNRQTETAKENRPRLSHLRESGQIEADADVVIFVHRDAYYKTGELSDEDKRSAIAIVEKQRNGPTGDVPLIWFDEYTRFDELAPARFDQFDEYNNR